MSESLDIPPNKTEGYLIDIYRTSGGWSGRIYYPQYREAWIEHGEDFDNQEKALEGCLNLLKILSREQTIAEKLEALIDELEQSGYSLSEIFDGMAEVFSRREHPSDVVRHLEKISAALEAKPQ